MSEFAIRLDLRELPVERFDAAVARAGEHAGFLMTAWQWTAWNHDGHAAGYAPRMLIMVPDFLNYARLGSTGQAKEIIRLPGSLPKVLKSALSNVVTNSRNIPGLATGDFWSAAETLTAYDMGLLPRNFAGEVILQYNLADFTWLFDRQQYMKSFSKLAANAAGWGVATQQVGKALSACARWNHSPARLMYTSGAQRREADLVAHARRERFTDTRFTLDLTQWPKELVCGEYAGELKRQYDNEWLLSYDAGISLLKNT